MITDNRERIRLGYPLIYWNGNGLSIRHDDLLKSRKFRELIDRLSKAKITK